MIIETIHSYLKEVVVEQHIYVHELMKNHTSFNIGGPADLMVEPGSEEEIRHVVAVCHKNEVPLLVIGRGSNILVADTGIRGVVLKVGKRFSRVTIKNELISAQAGVSLNSLSHSIMQHKLAGFEFAGGIPGSLGGALAMNAGAYGGEMKDVFISCRCMDQGGQIRTITKVEMEMGYRSSRIQKTKEIILSAELTLKKGQYQQIKFLMEDYWQRRITKQPYYLPSGGSVFKRPEGYFAGKLIEDCQLKGARVGGAMVSDLHAGFIVNTGEATAEDVVKLMALIQKRVKETFGVILETELRVIGAEGGE